MWLYYLAIISLGMVDMFATEWIINEFGLQMELNPVIRYIVREHGMTSAFWLRGLTTILGGGTLLFFIEYKNSDSARRMMKLGFWMSLAVVVWHIINFGSYWLT